MSMRALPLRLAPGADLRSSLAAVLAGQDAEAGFVLQGIGSLSAARIRLAGKDVFDELQGDLEILSLAGSLSHDGVHLHIAVSDANGRVTGGHMGPGCIIRTTAEVLVGLLPGYRFAREADAQTGYPELVIRERAGPTG
jgi:predicted DNA-binding protein with PD1-like motif